MYTANYQGTLLDLSKPRVMGIINLTPDSFYDGGKTQTEKAILEQAEQMLDEGASFLDVGGYSSRPGATDITVGEELGRVVPTIEALLRRFPEALISVDTFRSEVAIAAVDSGAVMINDISAGRLDPKMMPAVANLQVPYVMMHMKGTPQTMSGEAQYQNLMEEIIYYFSERIAQAKSYGINDYWIDPGFGFAKIIDQNFELLHHLELLQHLDAPILVGISRKSMIYKTLNVEPGDALNGTTALHSICLMKGANILRVHDVAPAMECIKLFEKMDTPS